MGVVDTKGGCTGVTFQMIFLSMTYTADDGPILNNTESITVFIIIIANIDFLESIVIIDPVLTQGVIALDNGNRTLMSLCEVRYLLITDTP